MLSRTVSSLSRMAPQALTGGVNALSPRQYSITAPRPPTELSQKLKVTIIPGDGVGPELIYTVQDIVKQTGIPIEFEGEFSWPYLRDSHQTESSMIFHFSEIFLSEVHYTRSSSIENAVESIGRNNNVALKGAIEESAVLHTEGELQGLNMRLRRSLDLFANVVHIKVRNSRSGGIL